MKVYVAFKECHYESGTLLGVCKSKEDVETMVEEKFGKDLGCDIVKVDLYEPKKES